MKSILSLTLFSAPLTGYSQDTSTPSSYGAEILLIIAFAVLLFLLIRNIVCWYWKINQSIKNQKEIIRLLKDCR
ncbi:hypothetical protein EZS27_026744 [termite gut metagenome]|uniref:Uncharacterized protein n=1 Tax=termite gut metagenome TaxID=433724 RepID=A0A5J4QRR9_9ZZZZ